MDEFKINLTVEQGRLLIPPGYRADWDVGSYKDCAAVFLVAVQMGSRGPQGNPSTLLANGKSRRLLLKGGYRGISSDKNEAASRFVDKINAMIGIEELEAEGWQAISLVGTKADGHEKCRLLHPHAEEWLVENVGDKDVAWTVRLIAICF